jgi:hypothetical protein
MDIMKNGIIRMTKDEAIETFKKLLDVPNEMIVKYDSVLTEDNYKELIKIRCAEEMAISALEEVQQLHEIGTVFEFRELKEKATAKKGVKDKYAVGSMYRICPVCYAVGLHPSHNYCHGCGQKLDWSKEKE